MITSSSVDIFIDADFFTTEDINNLLSLLQKYSAVIEITVKVSNEGLQEILKNQSSDMKNRINDLISHNGIQIIRMEDMSISERPTYDEYAEALENLCYQRSEEFFEPSSREFESIRECWALLDIR